MPDTRDHGTTPADPAARLVHLDVREDIRRGAEPFAKIMAAVNALAPDETLVLRVPFEPVPLYGVLGRRGFAHRIESLGPDDWAIHFFRERGAGAPAPRLPSVAAPARVVIDVRGLEPPGPMVRVLAALDGLQPGQRLEIVHDRRPTLLYPLLDDRGFAHATDESEPGAVRILVERQGSGA